MLLLYAPFDAMTPFSAEEAAQILPQAVHVRLATSTASLSVHRALQPSLTCVPSEVKRICKYGNRNAREVYATFSGALTPDHLPTSLLFTGGKSLFTTHLSSGHSLTTTSSWTSCVLKDVNSRETTPLEMSKNSQFMLLAYGPTPSEMTPLSAVVDVQLQDPLQVRPASNGHERTSD